MRTFSGYSLFSACVVPLCRKRARAALILDFVVEKENARLRDVLDLSRSSLYFSPVRSLAVKAATRVAENNDIIAGPLAAYGN